MNRKKFLKLLALLPLTGNAMKSNDLFKIEESSDYRGKMPVLFLGHGSPMNAIEENEFVEGFRNVGKTIPKPKAILCVSAHWETGGTFITAMKHPRTIHDFGGFPKALYEVQYPAPGSPDLAHETTELVTGTKILPDEKWGLDHGCWSVVKHLYPKADVPIVQLSLDFSKSPQEHYALAKQLQPLRSNGILIIGSGNMVHNLGMVDWNRLNDIGYGYDWALEANDKMKKFILSGDDASLIGYKTLGNEIRLSIPTPEHFLPILYVIALRDKNEKISLFNDKSVAGSLTMTSVRIA